jgi:CRISPR/Cas system-associated exonuclease Cas4 (RecB family)
VAELTNDFSWSVSRHRLFEECPRKYYFSYYGSWGGWDERAPEETRLLYRLKQVATRQMWLGSAVHAQVRKSLEALRAGGDPQVDEAVDRVVQTMRQDFRDSREGKWIHNPKNICRLLEHERGIRVTDERWKALAEQAKDCVRGFFRSPYYEIARTLPREGWVSIDTLESFHFEGWKLWVSLDFSFRGREGRFTVVDWKTGRRTPGGPEEALQLTTYALYAKQRLAASPSKLFVCAYYLLGGAGEERPIREDQLAEARRKILDSVRAMRGRLDDPERNLASLGRFPRTDDLRNCDRCAFFVVCWKGERPAAAGTAEGDRGSNADPGEDPA